MLQLNPAGQTAVWLEGHCFHLWLQPVPRLLAGLTAFVQQAQPLLVRLSALQGCLLAPQGGPPQVA